MLLIIRIFFMVMTQIFFRIGKSLHQTLVILRILIRKLGPFRQLQKKLDMGNRHFAGRVVRGKRLGVVLRRLTL